ncbi:hypothetical protein CAPTEDRAFT_188375 [Capitella teleta]|uniref:Ima1 N-terminal domain-containing protein n=1 Tax=Capitella teleta TaxID=283909 RepID=R7VI55_CAPTE|nr:hypothetical protein CAPTEDRAFT_188375 [Capitella teleta]|eukprot:ELU18533.1 hypothetical protein CAPTEDRAFT_188375 [Capitella teleta]
MSDDAGFRSNVVIGSSALIAACVGGFGLYRTVRPYFHIKVTCWFCQSTTRVPYGNRNCWDCPQCEQYNGFTKDGDYNKPIPAQWSCDLNHPITAETKDRSPDHFNSGSDQLCEACNRNQLLKIRQLSNFVPYNEVNFNQEVTAYKAHLEQVYHLCLPCEIRVQRLLEQQDFTLAQKFESSLHSHNASLQESTYLEDSLHMREKHPSIYVSKLSSFIRLLNFFLSILLVLGLVRPGGDGMEEEDEEEEEEEEDLQGDVLHELRVHHLSLLIAGLSFSLLAIFLLGKQRVHGMDALAALSWLLTYMFHSPAVISLLPLDDYSQLQMTFAIICCMVSVCVIILPRRPHRPAIRMLKKRRSYQPNGSSSVQPTPPPPPQRTKKADPLDVFETLSIGEPSNQWGASEGPFKVFQGDTLLSRPQKDVMQCLGQRKPLIMPAKFTLQNNSGSNEPFKNDGLPNLFSDVRNRGLSSRIESDRASLFSVHRTPSQWGESSDEEVEEEGEMRMEEEPHVCPAVKRKKHTLLKQVFIGVFLGINIFIIFNFIYTHFNLYMNL